MSLDYRGIVCAKRRRESKRIRGAVRVRSRAVVVRVAKTGMEGMAELAVGLDRFPPTAPVDVSFRCHGTRKYIGGALEVVSG